jgi:hypothetical protein
VVVVVVVAAVATYLNPCQFSLSVCIRHEIVSLPVKWFWTNGQETRQTTHKALFVLCDKYRMSELSLFTCSCITESNYTAVLMTP